jgi:hypothetical protein
VFEWFGTKAFLPSGPVLKLMSKLFCDQTKWEEDFCENIFFLLSGSDPANFNEVIIIYFRRFMYNLVCINNICIAAVVYNNNEKRFSIFCLLLTDVRAAVIY